MTYLDHAATTPMLPEAAEAMTSRFGVAGNPSSLHASGRAARKVVEESRETLAAAFGARPSEVVFTGGGTESDNLAVKGLFWARHDADPARVRVLVGAAEHHAVLDTAVWLAAHEGARLELLPVDRAGRVTPDVLEAALAREPGTTALVSVMWANNEVGTVSPIAELVQVAHAHGVPIHSDAVQAAGPLSVDFAASGLDAMSVTAHKLGGPVGAGALVVGRSTVLTPALHGGGQERDVRSGTLDTAGIAGFAAAAAVTVAGRDRRMAELVALRARLVAGILAEVPDAIVNGDPQPGPDHRLPGLAHVSFPGCEGDALLMLLDARGIECSTGSACSAGVPQASHVLLAMGIDDATARGSLRFSLGHTSTQADVDDLVAAIAPVVERGRRAGALARTDQRAATPGRTAERAAALQER
jgi:cysteine desulfurase